MPHAPTLEERVSHIEQDLAELKSRFDRLPAGGDSGADAVPNKSGNPWIEGAGDVPRRSSVRRLATRDR